MARERHRCSSRGTIPTGITGLGVGLRDGDTLTRAGGTPATSDGAVVAAVTAALRRQQKAMTAEVMRAAALYRHRRTSCLSEASKGAQPEGSKRSVTRRRTAANEPVPRGFSERAVIIGVLIDTVAQFVMASTHPDLTSPSVAYELGLVHQVASAVDVTCVVYFVVEAIAKSAPKGLLRIGRAVGTASTSSSSCSARQPCSTGFAFEAHVDVLSCSHRARFGSFVSCASSPMPTTCTRASSVHSRRRWACCWHSS